MQNPIKTLARSDPPDKGQGIGPAGVVALHRLAQEADRGLIKPLPHRSTQHFARGNLEEERQIGACLHNGQVRTTQHEKDAVRLDGTWERDGLVLASRRVDCFVHGCISPLAWPRGSSHRLKVEKAGPSPLRRRARAGQGGF